MKWLEILTTPGSEPFSIALGVMLCLALLEGVSALVGMGISSVVDALLPDIDIDAPDLSPASHFLNWLQVGRVPVMMLFVVFLTAFGLIGLGLQSLALGTFSQVLPRWLAAIPATLLALPVVALIGDLLRRVIPEDETEAVSQKSFMGRVAVITLGTAKAAHPAEAKLTDEYGQSHYLMVEPDNQVDTFTQGEHVLLVRQEGALFRVIANPHQALID